MNKQIIKAYLKAYKNQFDEINQEELYKWKAVKQFQDHWDIDAVDFYSMVEESLESVENLLESGQYYPQKMLLKNIKIAPEYIRTLFRELYDEEQDLYERIKSFRSKFIALCKPHFPKLTPYQDDRAILVYLSLRYPENYYFYKYGLIKSFTEKIGYGYKPVAGRIENVGQFQTLCDLLKHELVQDQELLKLHKNRISDDCYYDEQLNILTQDFVYAVVYYLEIAESPSKEKSKETKTISRLSSEIEMEETKVDLNAKTVNYIQKNSENKRIGDLGELWVVEYEKQKLISANKPKLAKKVSHVAKAEGDGLGYDILSYDLDGKKLYIEVKTTTGKSNSTFYITRNELERSKKETNFYRLYRVYNYDEETDTAALLIIKGDLSPLCQTPLTYKATMKEVEDEVS